MKFTVGELMASYRTLASLLNDESNKKIPAIAAYRMSRLFKKLEPEFLIVEERRVALVKEFAVEKDGNYEVPPEKVVAFSEKYAPILAEKVEIDVKPLKLSEFEHFTTSAGDMIALDKLIEE
jgi:hypothetical protein